MPESGKLSPDDIDLSVELYKAGRSLSRIAAAFGVTKAAIHYHLTKRIKLRQRGDTSKRSRFYRGGGRHDKSASRAVARALAAGTLTRPDACENCSREPYTDAGRLDIVAHHDDYNKPLDVRWLCRPCHYYWHQQNTAIEAVKKPRKRRKRGRK